MCYNITSLCSDVFIIYFRITAHVLWLYLSLAQSSFGTRDGFTHQTDRLPAESSYKNMKTWVILKYRESKLSRCCVTTAALQWHSGNKAKLFNQRYIWPVPGNLAQRYESIIFHCSWWYLENRVATGWY